jgi:type II secretory pathway pseudopilin PulG
MTNKGAMFGLDARIALAIFGALSVISGAALYSAIQTAKAEQYRQYFVELLKASEQYYLDTGSPLSVDAIHTLNASNLIQNTDNVANWKGPYFEGSPMNAITFKTPLTKSIDSGLYSAIIMHTGSTWTDNSIANNCVIGDADCFEYSLISNGANDTKTPLILDVFNLLDKLVDNSDGQLTGKVRYIKQSTNLAWVMYKGQPHKRPS